MPFQRKFFTLILCFTVLVAYSRLSADNPDIGLQTKSNSRQCVQDDPSPECQAHDEGTAVSAESKTVPDNEENRKCTHGTGIDCIEAFHSAMASACHEYIPQGKFAEARNDINKMVEACKAISEFMPGCTYGKDLNTLFVTKRDEFAKSMNELEKVSRDIDDQTFKKAFDKMHTAFTEMNGVLALRPAGVEEFHNILAVVWHDYLPHGNYVKIKESVPELNEVAEHLTKVRLDDRLADRQENFTHRAGKLVRCVHDLELACNSGDDNKIAEATKLLHESFKEMTSVY